MPSDPTQLEAALSLATRDGRVCPMPQLWNRIWEGLPKRERRGAGYSPPAPLILTAWHTTSYAEKRERFRLHLRWAHDHGTLGDLLATLESTNDDDWLTDE